MDQFENAVADLIAAAGPGKDSVEEAYACAQRLLAELQTAAAATQQRALAGLADVLPTAPLACASVVALVCGALVENGGDPERPLDGLLSRLPEALAGAAAANYQAQTFSTLIPDGLWTHHGRGQQQRLVGLFRLRIVFPGFQF